MISEVTTQTSEIGIKNSQFSHGDTETQRNSQNQIPVFCLFSVPPCLRVSVREWLLVFSLCRRVEPSVTWWLPHRSGRADFQHPVLPDMGLLSIWGVQF
jgi:hypothetical protein